MRALGVQGQRPVELVDVGRIAISGEVDAIRDPRVVKRKCMDESALVLADVCAEQPLTVSGRHSTQAQAAHGGAAVGFVEDDVLVELPGPDVIAAHEIFGVGDVLDHEDAPAVVADRIEAEETIEIDVLGGLRE